MREETEQQAVISQPPPPVEAPSELGRSKNRWMRYFITEDIWPEHAPIRDLQRRACWIGLALILQALNEAVALVPVYLPGVPFLTLCIGLISFSLITGSLIALWTALRPAGSASSLSSCSSPRWEERLR